MQRIAIETLSADRLCGICLTFFQAHSQFFLAEGETRWQKQTMDLTKNRAGLEKNKQRVSQGSEVVGLKEVDCANSPFLCPLEGL